ncbi:ABC transporter permease [Tunicatimonas pelagia]|uniref:ABC transporter permease n=1 Tax=Tunicatimonas pelagia TaxID=931531 RepID=UPI0026670438|nr:ABC transporter permease [Tunicatimonas pelagia]WKN41795.1 ABC transporter permease [Tunicatimonas pelagia]
MIRNYLLIALRNARRNKVYLIINVLGLGLGLACMLTAYTFFAFNQEFDSYFSDTDNIYRVQRTLAGERASQGIGERIPLPLAVTASEEISGVQEATRVFAASELLRTDDEVFSEYIGFTDTNFFTFFPFQIKFGETGSYTGTDKVILNEELASKFFEDKNPVGQTLTLRFGDGQEVSLTVGAVVTYPENTSFYYDAFVPLSHYLAIGNHNQDDWAAGIRSNTFLKLSSSQAVNEVNTQLEKFVATANATDITYKYRDFWVIPFRDSRVNENEIRGDATYTNRRINPVATIIFGTLAFLILLLACFNLTNTSIALASRRLKEIGIRKVMGGMRHQLVVQHLLEIILIGVLAIGVGWLIAQYLSVAFFNLWDTPFSLDDVNLWNMSLALVLLLVLVAMIAGLYPAIYSTRFHPATILKGNLKLKGSNWFTRSLLSLQFALSIALLIGGFVAISNTEYLQNLDLGYDIHEVISLGGLEPPEAQMLLIEAQQHPKVKIVSALRGSDIWGNGSKEVQVDTATFASRIFQVDANYLETVGMDISVGRGFNADRASDYTEAVLVNVAFVEKMNWDDPINQRILYQDTARYVIGVVQNIVNNLYDNEQRPSLFRQIQPERYSKVMIKAAPDDLAEIDEYLQSRWKEIVPFEPYESSYLTQAAMYYPIREMRNLKKVYFFLAVLGGLLAVAGIFSLAQINIARRNKEIGVRKVLGASVAKIINTLNREFVWILAVSAVLGGGIGYLYNWAFLENFYAFHIEIGLFPLIVSGVIIVGIALLTTSLTIRRTANTNPAQVLRDE